MLTPEQLKEVLIDSISAGTNVAKTEGKLTVDFEDGTEGVIVFDLILSVKSITPDPRG